MGEGVLRVMEGLVWMIGSVVVVGDKGLLLWLRYESGEWAIGE